MKPHVRYCTSADGVQIAYTVYGSGRPLVFVLPWPTSIELDWDLPECASFYEALSPGRSIIRFDLRGTGASQRDVDDVSVPTLVGDVAAVVDHANTDEFDLFGGPGSTASVAAEFAALHPDRVGRVILWEPYVRPVPQDEALANASRMLTRAQWRGATRVMADSLAPRASLDVKKWITRVYRECISPDILEQYTSQPDDTSATLPRVNAPVLVLVPRNALHERAVESAREAARLLPDARFAAVPGESGFFFLLRDELVPLMLEFLGEGTNQSTDSESAAPAYAAGGREGKRETSVILFTDIADSTALTERMGDVPFRSASRALDADLRAAILAAGGRPVDGKLLGDGILATFTSAAEAIDAARRCYELSAASELRLHLGIHAGDVIHEEGNVFGGAVNIASRICGLAAPGEILVSDVVRGMARTSAGVEFEDRGEHEMKGVSEPVRLYLVRSPRES